MALYLLAAPNRGSAGYIVTRLWINLGNHTDVVSRDLLRNFDDPLKAYKLCKDAKSLRGLPSENEKPPERETNFLAEIPREVDDEEALRELAETCDAEATYMHNGLDWYLLTDDTGITLLRDAKLFKIEKPE